MSTNGIYGFCKNGIEKIDYNHYNSEPCDGLGEDIVENFIKCTSIEEINEIFDKITIVTRNTPITKEQINECKQWYFKNQYEYDYEEFEIITSNEPWYILLHPIQGDLCAYKNGFKYMFDQESSQEWEYIIDLDANTFVIKYFDKILGRFPLDNIPNTWYVNIEKLAYKRGR